MQVELVDEAIELLEKANAELEPELLNSTDARKLLKAYARAERLSSFGVAAIARKVDSTMDVARATGSSTAKAKAVVQTGKVLGSCDELASALQTGKISLDQANEIASAEHSAPGTAKSLVEVAQTEPFHVLKHESRRLKLEAEQDRDLARRQREARSARSYTDELGMIHIHMALQPHVGTPLVAKGEAEAARLLRAAKAEGRTEPFDRYLADAYASLLAGSGRGPSKRPELVVLVSHEVTKRGWKDVKKGEVCKIPGIGPIAPDIAKGIAEDAFLTGLFYDGKDLRHIKRWTRNVPIEVRTALELGDPPDFDGVKCVDCGNRFRTEFDHVLPHGQKGPASLENLKPRCWSCHREKTKRDVDEQRKREREDRALRNGEVQAESKRAAPRGERGP